MYKISVIIPVHNAEDTIKRSFDSILNQTFDFNDLEIIFIDDASKDNSLDIIQNFSEEYSNVKCVSLENNSGFAGRPRNIGIENANAPYIMFLDSDDLYFENACEILYNNITEHDLDMVSANYIRCVGNLIQPKYWDNIDLIDGEITIQNIEEQPNLFSIAQAVWCKIFRKDFILNNNIDFNEEIPAQDVVFVYECLLKANGIKYIDVPVVKYMPGYSNNVSMTSTRTKENLLNYLNAYKLMMDVLKANEDYEVHIRPHLNFWTANLIASEISNQDKIDLLRVAYDLYEIHQKHGLNPLNNLFKEFYENVYSKNFVEAVLLCDEISINLTENDYKVYNEISNRDIFIISDERLCELLSLEGYSVKLISFDENCDADNSINIYRYYSNTDNFIKKEEMEENKLISKFYDQDNFNYMIIDSGNIKLNYSNFSLSFDNMLEFQNYFITELLLKSNKKPFIITGDEIIDINPKIGYKIDNDSSYDLNYFKESFKQIYSNCIKEKYDSPKRLKNENKTLEDHNKSLNDKIKKLSSKNKKLKDEKNKLDNKVIKKNKKIESLNKSRNYYKNLSNEMKSSKSWKITKPLRKITSILKRK